jgi:hypothetical protein
MSETTSTGYNFGQRSTRGALMGLSWQRAATLGAGFALAVVLMAAGDPLAALVILGIVAGLVFGRVSQRSLLEWVRPGMRHGTASLAHHNLWRSAPPWGPSAPPQRLPEGWVRHERPELPPEWGKATWWELMLDGRALGVVADRDAKKVVTYTAALMVSGPELVLASEADREARVAAWGRVLAGAARVRGGLARLQVIERAVPDPVEEPGRWLEIAGTGASPAAHAAYSEVLDGLRQRATGHNVIVVAQVAPTKGNTKACMETLAGEVASLVRHLAGSGFAVGPLSVSELAGCTRAIMSPPGPEPSPPGMTPKLAGPVARRTHWGHIRTDNMWHACYWVAQWPRSDVAADWLRPLVLDPVGAIRTLSLILEPMAAQVALRKAEAEVMAQSLDSVQRGRWGFSDRARHEAQHQSALAREAELVEGHGGFRFAGIVAVSAAGEDALEAACRELEASAQRSKLELRRLWGQQAEALAALAPLGRFRLRRSA